jgi:eukaryotic translation initiation factor 2C
MQYRKFKEKKANPQPKRIVFFRDGVSEGQFRTVLESEVPLIKQACQRLEITPIPKLTVIVVGKRHHVRFFPKTDSDKSGNCPAGTVVDTGVVHPTEFDFYLQSHSGLLGTSRPAHYSVLLDENNMKTDMVQQLSFALCHVYARATRSVSIPAPVYYADIVCARAKNHYATDQDFTDTQTVEESDTAAKAKLEQYKQNFKPPHQNIAKTMYFS